MDRYGHLFPNALDDVARGLDTQRAAAYPRPAKDGMIIDLTEKKARAASDQRLRKWGRLDSNQRRTDYESAALTN
jgi:hypothetical protein